MSGQGHRRRRQKGQRRDRSVRLSLTVDEHAAIRTAADRLGMAVSAYASEVVVAAATQAEPPQWSPWRELMGEVIRAAGQSRHIGANLDQAVKALQAGGHPTRALEEYARVAAYSTRNLDELAEQIRSRLR
ncbi:hypothetical protein [Actinomadura hibisca]|uniref:hypothetical protein n=1 Tax=Actinomadura hibisca TaxID=68565 RepID=UPI000A86D94E|nr:hypothetical protein [Actinomadura hibisca]